MALVTCLRAESYNFPLVVYHRNGDNVAEDSVHWLDINCPDVNDKPRNALYGLQVGKLAAFCYNTAEDKDKCLRVVSDFMNCFLHFFDFDFQGQHRYQRWDDGQRHTDTLSDADMNVLWYTELYRPPASPAMLGHVRRDEELNAGKLARDFWGRCIDDAGVDFRYTLAYLLAFEFVLELHIFGGSTLSPCVA
ncbi:hypothetical protein BT96DRAFT_1068311 [Gymnopus androsaceus JB14]|uniref:Uncharacterized protein n=1 Tax=Gymnopus androsaceus JB14 TaxID=1447944 RepID=A0A6A4I2I6_9AGAR|nr:hypothetical protein BT96DRAFT_1068311 [Gymnopus androsaceus JB14]